MIGWRALLTALLMGNAALAAWGVFWAGDESSVLLTPGLRAEWVAVEKPWQQAVDVAQNSAPPGPKINLKEGQAQLDRAIASANEQVSRNPDSNLQCLLWGPLLESESARVQASLAEWSGKIQRLERQVPIGYVVYLPQDIVNSGVGIRQLASQGITDMFFITTPGPLQGTISLGLFRDLDRAEVQKEELQRKGVNGVQIRERLGPVRVFFELRGTQAQITAARSAFELNRRGELGTCEATGPT
ncbi:MAG TPA: hypothetical protein VFV28_03605 [Limnobacter sp.]|nr:hypothetical protein [Limnobacter sp.]